MGQNGIILMRRQVLKSAFQLAELNASFTTEEIQLEVEAAKGVKPGVEFTEEILREEFTELDERGIDPCWIFNMRP